MKNFVVYKSGAGSGKTFTLVKEYLRLALLDPERLDQNFRRILAITFTNKAAAEMKSRVIETLRACADDAELPKSGRLLCSELHVSESELKRRSAVLLKNLLHHYSDLAISTIDSFTHKIVRTFSYDLKLPAGFSVETDIKLFYDKVIAQLFSRVGEDEGISDLLRG